METFNITSDKFSNIFYRKSGKGPAIVFIHGFPADGTLWNAIIPALANSFTVVVPDLPGSGKSSLDDKDPLVEDLAEVIRLILENEQVSEAVVGGHSMGGYVALAFADKYSSLLKGISLVHSTAAADTDEKKEQRRKSIELIRKGGKEPFVRGMVPNLFSAEFKANHGDVIQRQTEQGLMLKDESLIAFYSAMIKRPARTDTLTGVNFPVQWILGADDGVIPADAALKQSKLADINFVSLYETCGHMSMLEQPERLANDLNEFITYCYNR